MKMTDESSDMNKPLKNTSYSDRSLTPTTMSLSLTSSSSQQSSAGDQQEELQQQQHQQNSSSHGADQQEELQQQQQQQQNSRKRKSNVLVYNDDNEISNSQDEKTNDIGDDDDNDNGFDVGFVDDLDDTMSGLSGLTEHVPIVYNAITSNTDNSMIVNMNNEFIVPLPYKGSTIRLPIELYLSCNDDIFSQYQCYVRKLIEFFETKPIDLSISVQGRNRKILLGQVGIRCRHCYNTIINPNIIDNKVHHTSGSIYYPSKLLGIYQACQNMASLHLLNNCPNMSLNSRETLKELYEKTIITKKPAMVAGKELWASTATAIGVYEDNDDQILRFDPCWSRKVLTG